MSVVAVKVDEDNKVNITLEELNKMLDDAYNEGYKAGRNSVPYISPLTTPTYPQSPTTPTTPISPYWYCGPDVYLGRKTNVDDDLSVSGTLTRVKDVNITLSKQV